MIFQLLSGTLCGMKRRLITAIAFFSFFLFGFVDNLKGPVIPEILRWFGISYAFGSNILLAAYLGFMIAILAAGLLSARAGNRPVLLGGGLSLALGVAGTAFSPAVGLLLATFFAIGFGLGSIELGANGIITDLYKESSGKYLNILAFFHGGGAMIAPYLAGSLISRGLPWQGVYRLSLVPVLLLPLSLVLFRSEGRPFQQAKTAKSFSGLLGRDILLHALAIGLYVAAEIGIAAWLVDFLQKAKGYSVSGSSLMLSVYFGCIMLGRLLGSLLVEKIGYLRIMSAFVAAAILTLSAGLFLPATVAFLIPLTGLFFSIIFPTTTASAAGRYPEKKSAVLSILFLAAGIGGVLGPWGVGFTAEYLGIAFGFSLNIVFSGGMLLTLLILWRTVPGTLSPDIGTEEDSTAVNWDPS